MCIISVRKFALLHSDDAQPELAVRVQEGLTLVRQRRSNGYTRALFASWSLVVPGFSAIFPGIQDIVWPPQKPTRRKHFRI
jgi:hypothetical protein